MGVQAVDQYLAAVQAQLRAAVDGQRAELAAGGAWLAAALRAGRWWFVFGTGHSHLLALEVFYRAGGLARAVPMLDESVMLHRSASASTEAERRPELAAALLDRYGVGAGDVLTICSNSGRNALPVELALLARARGTRTIALTNRRHSAAFASRHASGRRLAEVADLVLDNAGVPGDAAVPVAADLDLTLGPTSTAVGAVLLHALTLEAVTRARAAGHEPEVYRSSNGAGEAANAALLARYRGVLPHL
jgi:uncharacterized phosphosugar-binding protein